MITFISTPKFEKKAIVAFIYEEQLKSKVFSFKNQAVKTALASLLKTKQFSAKKDQSYPLALEDKVVLLVGLGKKKELSLTSLRTSVKKALKSPYISRYEDVEIISASQDSKHIVAVLEGILIGKYSWDKYKTKEKDDKKPKEVNYFIGAKKSKALENIVTICEGVKLTRDLVNDNADLVTSDYLEKIVKDLIKGKKNISVEILGRKELKAKGLNLHLAVNQGSNKEPKLIIVKYSGAAKKTPYTAIIGKGITFDSGGLHVKTYGHMETMRMDMGGAASVIGILKNTIALKLKKNVIFSCAIAENAIDGNSYKPGDVIKSYSGKTVEIGNTDAEGRLVLADAIAYIVKNYKPARIIDIATLTGACIVALAYDHTGLVSNDDALAKKLLKSAKDTDDWAWQLPMYSELNQTMKSKIADICNISNIKGGGTITAAEFLRQFTENTKWAHLDIAGSAFVETQSRLYFGYGATGSSVRLLTNFIQNN